ncbi:MAG: hypothetical protein H7X99_11005 [Saprospiraceae bacterium]|nr:hypothetical protein [Saprospiraceae bacterium]
MAFLKHFYVLLLPVALIASCGAIKGTVITGTIKGAENMSVFLDNVSFTNPNNTILTEKIGADGKYKLSFPDGIKKGLYRLKIGEQQVDLIMDGSEKEVVVNANLADINQFNYTVTGSKLSEEYLRTVKDYIDKKIDVAGLTAYTSKTAV